MVVLVYVDWVYDIVGCVRCVGYLWWLFWWCGGDYDDGGLGIVWL